MTAKPVERIDEPSEVRFFLLWSGVLFGLLVLPVMLRAADVAIFRFAALQTSLLRTRFSATAASPGLPLRYQVLSLMPRASHGRVRRNGADLGDLLALRRWRDRAARWRALALRRNFNSASDTSTPMANSRSPVLRWRAWAA